ncbi:MAG: nucleotidyltransferase domain-containing protein [Limnospira sp. PMC 1291.21]|uniref:Nucleotidyltransferase domain-containing protein n=2 Tax=Limnospira TaxID=2596745 RepID=A0ABU9ETX4_LIMFS|nr:MULTISPECIES: nucleotidyltransferase domain-containing protein [Limnospira]EKD06828.1 DNA polymerase beta domain protein region [Arthrospira platensis C1]MDY7051578.1 nucleotidyltransferase domain-containing protein [Limnospira fusiformis LS22]MDT9178758.1 nucleotidyltransferase domain-containing protein [Limnospira sp. PMC 1238.20]MDT9188950.1 nucleotidyltransferase domain-containing protein [Limnospira sp. PMC 894.15]MDT9194002.1 nucleotidyltransferase domain-containing protein [Limnospir
MMNQEFVNSDRLAYWKQRMTQQAAQNKKLVNQARSDVDTIVEMLVSQFGVRRVILFGSLVRGRFRETSDIDLAVEGLRKKDYFLAVAEANDLTRRWVDLKPFEDLEPHFRDRVLQTGECVYEAG